MTTNEVEAPRRMAKNKNSFQQITVNFTPSVRHDTMEGRPYLVVPMVMLTEGVHTGSNGAIFYPAEELAKTSQVWNHKPIVVYHPQFQGKAVSACDPDILTNRKVGVVMNTSFSDGKLKAEAWLEEERLKAVDVRVLEALEQGTPMELSTGLFSANTYTDGEWEGEAYEAVARGYGPDHLALLPDKVGACSLADGAGLMVNREGMEKMDFERIGRAVVDTLAATGKGQGQEAEKQGTGGTDLCHCPECGATANHERGTPCNETSCPKCGTAMTGVAPATNRSRVCVNCATVYQGLPDDEQESRVCANCGGTLVAVVWNEQSYRDLQKEVEALLPTDGEDGALPYPYVEDLFPDHVIYDRGGRLFRQDFLKVDGKITLKGLPIEVVRVTQYEPITNASITEDVKMGKEKKELVDALVANAGTEWDEDDREALMQLEDDMLAKMIPVVNEQEAEVEEPVTKDVPEVEALAANTEVEAKKPVTAEEYVQNAPPEIRDMLAAGLQTHKAQRAHLVAAIAANEACKLTPDFLNAQPLDVLHNMAQMTAPKTATPGEAAPTYEGLGEVASTTKETPLVVPVMNFEGTDGD